MIPYLILLFIPATFALFNTRRLALPLWYMTFVIFVLFVGLRDEVGPDWIQYGRIHQSLAYADIWDIFAHAEPLSHALFWFSEASGYEVYLSNMVAAFLTMLGVFCFARRTANPWLAVVAATPYFIVVIGMSGIRQAMAAGIVLFLLSRWERYSFIKRGVFIFLAGMFHTSALVNNIFLIVKLNIRLRYKMVLGTAVLLVTLYLGYTVSAYSDNMMIYHKRYLAGESSVRSVGSLYHIGLVAIPALLGYIYRRRIIDKVHNTSLVYFGFYAALGAVLINIFSSTLASRLTIYLYFVPMMVYPALVAMFGRQERIGVSFAVIFFHMFVLIGWFQFGNVAMGYIPYRNLLFQ